MGERRILQMTEFCLLLLSLGIILALILAIIIALKNGSFRFSLKRDKKRDVLKVETEHLHKDFDK